MDNAKPMTMLATLGGQPQVVTFALDALLAAGEPITELIVLYLQASDPRIRSALQKVKSQFVNDHYGLRPLRLTFHPIRISGTPVEDIYDESDANSTWEAVNTLLATLKAEHRTLHICISGGRRILGLLTMSAAMLHFGHQDVLWHMYTPEQILEVAAEGTVMHLSPAMEGFRLIRVPMMPWGSYFPVLRHLARPVKGTDVLAGPKGLLDAAEQRRCQAVWARLTNRQQEVLYWLAKGETPHQVAQKLSISVKTVDSHKTVILAECRNAWDMPDDTFLDYRFLAEKFEVFPHVTDEMINI